MPLTLLIRMDVESFGLRVITQLYINSAIIDTISIYATVIRNECLIRILSLSKAMIFYFLICIVKPIFVIIDWLLL
ncbi:hypothetical protein PanWU01x14_260660 [Parasponia andersonii]|uniref:Uncharacterized protein n=1 Tax=Parasponia andersonii TaxID=3476 RepID=A0A2P5B8Z5_PARAD|nr:hypothetical protein PanWU01x14_260660 [Parasponia andersonii]